MDHVLFFAYGHILRRNQIKYCFKICSPVLEIKECMKVEEFQMSYICPGLVCMPI